MGKIKLQKIVGNLLDKLRKLYMSGHLESLSLPQAIENSGQLLLLAEQIFHRKQSLGAPGLRWCQECFDSLKKGMTVED